MVQVKNGSKAGNNNRFKRDRGHQRGPQIQLKKASEVIERALGTSGRESLRGSWEGLKHFERPPMQLRGPQMRLRGPQRQQRERQR